MKTTFQLPPPVEVARTYWPGLEKITYAYSTKQMEDAISGALRVACALLAECEAVIGTVEPECDTEAEMLSKLLAQIDDFLTDAGFAG
jgi:hypothetical protein